MWLGGKKKKKKKNPQYTKVTEKSNAVRVREKNFYTEWTPQMFRGSWLDVFNNLSVFENQVQ